MDHLDRNPTFVAAYSAWEHWDERAQSSLGASHYLDQPLEFSRTSGAELFNALIYSRILPEICMFRTEALHAILSRPSLSYWSYVWLANLFDLGDVVFMPTPYYRSIAVHRIDGPADHVGANEVIYARDAYEGGLEYLAHRIFKNMGCEGVPADQVPVVAEMIGRFMTERLPPAIQLLCGRKNYIGAYEYLTRRLARGINNDDLYAFYSDFYRADFRERLARLARLAEYYPPRRSPRLRRSAPSRSTSCRMARPGRRTWRARTRLRWCTLMDDFATVRLRLNRGASYFVTDAAADRDALLAEGVAPGLVLRLEHLLLQFTI